MQILRTTAKPLLVREVFLGFDLFVASVHNGERAFYEPRIAEEIFDRNALAPSRLSYADGHAEIYGDRDGNSFDGFMLSHFRGDTIVERALEIASVTKSLIFWPSNFIFVAVTDKAVIDHLPPELNDGIARVALVRTVAELWRAINAEEDNSEGIDLLLP